MKRVLIFLLALVMTVGATGCGNTEEKWQEQHELGIRYLTEGNYEEAIIAFTAAIEIDAKRESGYLDRANAYFHMQNETAALQDVAEALSIVTTRYEETAPTDDEIAQLEDALAQLLELSKEWEKFRAVLLEYLSEEQINPIFVRAHESTLENTLTGYRASAVSTEPFVTGEGADLQANPPETNGFISGCLRDVDCDGERELISTWSNGERLYLKLTEVNPNGVLTEEDTDLYYIPYSSNLDAVLYHRPNTDQWLVALQITTPYSYTGARGDTCLLYQFTDGEVKLVQSWEANNMVFSNYTVELPETVNWQLEALQWPIAGGEFLGCENPGELDDMTYLIQLRDASTSDGSMGEYENVTYRQQFISEEKLQQQSLPDAHVVGRHAGEALPIPKAIGLPLSQLTAQYGPQYELDGYEGSFSISYGAMDFNALIPMNEENKKVQGIIAVGAANFGNGLKVSATYPEITEVVANAPTPTGFNNMMDGFYEYYTNFKYEGMSYYYTWLDDPQTTPAVQVEIRANDTVTNQ